MNFRTLIILLIALVIVVPVASYEGFHYVEPKEQVVASGDNVSLWYYGYITINGNKLIFDTNMASVANNNTTYPKAPDFSYHPHFKVLNDTVGSGSLVKGFDNGLIGMAKGETSTIVVPPSLGYGLMNTSLIVKVPLAGTVSMYQQMNATDFQTEFKETPIVGETLKSPALGWDVYVMNVQGDTVKIQNQPVTGTQYFPYPNVKGFSIIDEKVTGTGMNTTINYYTSVANGTLLPIGAYVSEISGSYYYLNGNSYLVGRTLYFVVQVVTVSK